MKRNRDTELQIGDGTSKNNDTNKRQRTSGKFLSAKDSKILILDIEGTTTPITFVSDILFPYIRENLEAYLKETMNTEQTKQDIEDLKAQAMKDEKDGQETPQINSDKDQLLIEQVVKNVIWNMDRDRKVTALKQLQGHMWDKAYKEGTLKGKVYRDAFDAIVRWKWEGKKIYIYSSGSVQAQKLLFKYSEHGDMSHYLDGYYDTKHPGMKLETKSYEIIAEEVLSKEEDSTVEKKDILFVTDNFHEAVAAKSAGICCALSVRENTMLDHFQIISNFGDL